MFHPARPLDLAGENPDERLPERRVEHGVDDGVGQRGDVAHPQEQRHGLVVEEPQARPRADGGHDVDGEEGRHSVTKTTKMMPSQVAVVPLSVKNAI